MGPTFLLVLHGFTRVALGIVYMFFTHRCFFNSLPLGRDDSRRRSKMAKVAFAKNGSNPKYFQRIYRASCQDENGMDSSSSPSGGEMLACSSPLIEQRLRPQQEQALKCPRCDSTHTKFCYYNNYSLSQPRYFCKTCRRYWTKGGTLRNIPVGGGCRKNKKVSSSSSKKSSNGHHHNSVNHNNPGPFAHNPTDLHLSFPEVHLSHISNLLGTHHGGAGGGLGNHGFDGVLENARPLDFMEGKFEAIIGSSRSHDFMGGNCEMGMTGVLGDTSSHGGAGGLLNFHGFCSPFGVIDGNGGGFMESCQRLMLPYGNDGNVEQYAIDVKPNTKLLSLDWQDQGCSDAGKDSFMCLNSLGSWNGMVCNGVYEPSTTNPLV